MVARGKDLAATIERRRREREVAGVRFVDLRFDIEDEETGEILLSAGGRWDRRLKAFDGEAEQRIVVRCHPGQRRAVLWFAGWLEAHRHRRDHPPAFDPKRIAEYLDGIDAAPEEVYSALFAGGRRAGKTWIAMSFAVAYAVTFPGARVILAGPDEKDWPELIGYVDALVPEEWLNAETSSTWTLAHETRIELRSAYDPDALKSGHADLIVLNEGQRMKSRAFSVARGNIVDRSGLVIVCANPPNKRGDQQWVSDFAAEAQRGERAGLYVEFDALANPHIDRLALVSMAGDVDERAGEIEIFGRFLSPEDAVAYNWSRLDNERPVPEVGDVTAEFLEAVNEGMGIRQVIGIDVQTVPYIAAVVYRFFGSTDTDKVIAWIVDEIALPGGDEVDLADAMKARGYLPDETLLVVDASGQYQHSRRRSTDAPPPEWRGRGSFSLFKGAGFWRCVPPDRKRKNNPEIVDRVRAFTSMIHSKKLGRRLFADPRKAPFTCKAIREWRQVHGRPSRAQDMAHMGDGASYPIIRLFPRRLRGEKNGGMDPVTNAADRAPAATPRTPRRGRPRDPDRLGPRRGGRRGP